MTEQELLSLKQEIEEAKDKASQLKGKLEHLTEELKTNWGVSVKTASKRLEELEMEVQEMSKSIAKDTEILEKELYDDED